MSEQTTVPSASEATGWSGMLPNSDHSSPFAEDHTDASVGRVSATNDPPMATQSPPRSAIVPAGEAVASIHVRPSADAIVKGSKSSPRLPVAANPSSPAPMSKNCSAAAGGANQLPAATVGRQPQASLGFAEDVRRHADQREVTSGALGQPLDPPEVGQTDRGHAPVASIRRLPGHRCRVLARLVPDAERDQCAVISHVHVAQAGIGEGALGRDVLPGAPIRRMPDPPLLRDWPGVRHVRDAVPRAHCDEPVRVRAADSARSIVPSAPNGCRFLPAGDRLGRGRRGRLGRSRSRRRQSARRWATRA